MVINMERNVLRQNSTEDKEVICSSAREITAPTWHTASQAFSLQISIFTS